MHGERSFRDAMHIRSKSTREGGKTVSASRFWCPGVVVVVLVLVVVAVVLMVVAVLVVVIAESLFGDLHWGLCCIIPCQGLVMHSYAFLRA